MRKPAPFSFADLQTQDTLLPPIAHLPDITNKIRAAEKAEQDRLKAR